MTKPAELNRFDLAKGLMFKQVLVSAAVLITAGVFAQAYVLSLAYGVVVFLANSLVFSLYVFRFAGSRASGLMLQSFGKGTFFKLLLFALALLVIFRFDSRAMEPAQTAAIFSGYFFMQAVQIGLSVKMAKAL